MLEAGLAEMAEFGVTWIPSQTNFLLIQTPHDGGKVYNGTEETHRIHVYSQEWNLGPEGYEAVW